MDKPYYKKSPIGYIDSLASALSLDKNRLVEIINKADSYYYLGERIVKPNGSIRETYGVEDDLKIIQKRILKKLYYNTHFPRYLHGSVKDPDNPRTHITAAEAHAKSNPSILVEIDISNFFPSLTYDVIFNIWKRFFNFPDAVAESLTKLTTYNGFLPQGASTSPGLANLAFWDDEFEVANELQQEGYIYTRYVDDVVVSSQESRKMSELSEIFKIVFGMFRRKGVNPNRNKINISTSGKPMRVHNLNINAGFPTLPKKERSKIRAAVYQCEEEYKDKVGSEAYRKLWQSTEGRVNYLEQFHSTEARKYIKRLQAVRPE